MSTQSAPTSGTDLVDELLDQVHIGDNLVFIGDDTAPLDLLVRRYLDAATGHGPVVVVTVRRPWQGPVPDGVHVLDWSAVVTGRASPHPCALATDATLEDALASVRAADEAVGTGAVFAFDRLSAVQAAWSDEAALELFLSTCPRLYRRRSLALWPIEVQAHRPSFLRRLTEVTQVVVEVSAGDTSQDLLLTVRKADGRAPDVVGRSRRARIVGDNLQGVGAPTNARQRLGGLIRDQRLTRGMAQAELARRVGISPSALSQVERGVRGPSGDTLVRLWEVLGVPFGPRPSEDAGYEVSRRSGRERRQLQDGLAGERLLESTTVGSVWLLTLEPGARGDRAPFAVKAPESATVVRGVVDLHLSGRTETLHEGDALLTVQAPVIGWANPGTTPAEMLWTVHAATGRMPPRP